MIRQHEVPMQSRQLKLVALAFLLLAITGCAGQVTSEVTRFHELEGLVIGSARVVAMDEAKQSSLEFESYAAIVGVELGRLGFTPPDSLGSGPAGSDFTVAIDYAVFESTDIEAYRIYGPTVRFGAYYPYHYGRHRHGFYNGFGVGYGYPGYAYVRPTFTRHLELSITRTADNKRIFEGRVDSRGRSRQLREVMPYLVMAMFEGYPGVSGETHRVAITVEEASSRDY